MAWKFGEGLKLLWISVLFDFLQEAYTILELKNLNELLKK